MNAPTEESPRPLPPKPPRRPLWPVAVVGVAVLVGAGVLAARLATRAKGDDATARARLDAVVAAEGDPPPPPSCVTTERSLIDRLARAGTWLHDATAGSPRPQDRDALALLANVKDAAGSAEYWALLSRARLVVEPTTDGALAAAKTALERCPELAQGYNLVGNAEQRAQRFDAAATAYRKALALAPDYVAPRFNLGLLALRSGDQSAAITAFDAVLSKDPLHPRAHLGRGQARLSLGQIQGALDDLEASTLRHPSDADAWLLLGQARVRAGANTTAVEAFCKAKQLGNLDAGRLCR
jgi:tetratricopeptide (TPR) repeat protein